MYTAAVVVDGTIDIDVAATVVESSLDPPFVERSF